MRVNSNGTTVTGYDDYDPLGMIINRRSYTTGTAEKYKFTGKERDTETNYDYFGARYYDNRIGRWHIPDPMTSKYPGLSPYNYYNNNPLVFVDTNGEDWYSCKGMLYYHPDVHSQSDCPSGVTSIGKEYTKTIDGTVLVHYRSDGNIFYPIETDAYKRVINASKEQKNIEEHVFILANGCIVTPDYLNTSTECSPTKYGYIVSDGIVYDPVTKNSFEYINAAHTHFDRINGDYSPSGEDCGYYYFNANKKLFTIFDFNGDATVYWPDQDGRGRFIANRTNIQIRLDKTKDKIYSILDGFSLKNYSTWYYQKAGEK